MADRDSRYLIGRAGDRDLWRVMRLGDQGAEAIIGWGARDARWHP
jgi:hypothetical protein